MNQLVNDKDCCVLVLSCDKYSDIWLPFFSFFQKYWPDCPFPIYLGTNKTTFNFANVKQIFSNKNSTWSDELQLILKQIPEKYIILILEDYFIYKKVKNNDLFKIIETIQMNSAAYVKLAAFPAKYDQLWPYEVFNDLGAIKKNSTYRVCLQTAIWDKDILLGLIRPEENPWQFEIEASKRSNSLENLFLCVIADPSQKIVHGPIQYYCTALSEGKWMRGAIRLCRKENVFIDVKNRRKQTVYEELLKIIYISMPIGGRKIINYVKNKAKRNKDVTK
jgi:hypothetical protein